MDIKSSNRLKSMNGSISGSIPFIGKRCVLIERIDSLGNDWHVEFWREHYYFLGIEMFTYKKKKLISTSSSRVLKRKVV